MSQRRMNAFSCLALALSTITVAGCNRNSYERQYYILEATRQRGPAEVQGDATLDVRRLNVDAAYAARDLVYRLDESRWERDYYRQFLIAPGAMITEKTRRWLADSGLFRQVLTPGSQVLPTHTLEGTVTALYGDFTDESAAKAVMEIRYFLIRHEGTDTLVVFSQSYRAANPVSDRTAQALMDALSNDLVEILTRLEEDLRESLADGTAQALMPKRLD